MPKRKYFRRIYPAETEAEYARLRAKYPDCVEPDWRNCWVQVESTEDCRCGHTQDDHTLNYFPSSYNCSLCDCQRFRKLETITALVEFDTRTYISMLEADNPTTALEIINWADGYLANFPQYEFQVPLSNTRIQKALLRHFGLEGEVESPRRTYLIRRQ